MKNQEDSAAAGNCGCRQIIQYCARRRTIKGMIKIKDDILRQFRGLINLPCQACCCDGCTGNK